MASNLVIDEMFPDEGGSSFMEVDDGQLINAAETKEAFVPLVKDTYSKGAGTLVHTDFHNDFGDIFDDEDLS